MKRLILFIAGAIACIGLQFCSATKSSMARKKDDKSMASVSYSRDIAPIMAERCTPCHFPDGGKKKFLEPTRLI